MKIDMLLYMETEEDDEPMTSEQWKKELNAIVKDVTKYINRKHATYVKNADGEFAFDYQGEYEWKESPIKKKL